MLHMGHMGRAQDGVDASCHGSDGSRRELQCLPLNLFVKFFVFRICEVFLFANFSSLNFVKTFRIPKL